LKNMKVNGKDDIPYIMENKIHVWNHQPAMVPSKWPWKIGKTDDSPSRMEWNPRVSLVKSDFFLAKSPCCRVKAPTLRWNQVLNHVPKISTRQRLSGRF
jgi:hypothetical protein